MDLLWIVWIDPGYNKYAYARAGVGNRKTVRVTHSWRLRPSQYVVVVIVTNIPPIVY